MNLEQQLEELRMIRFLWPASERVSMNSWNATAIANCSTFLRRRHPMGISAEVEMWPWVLPCVPLSHKNWHLRETTAARHGREIYED